MEFDNLFREIDYYIIHNLRIASEYKRKFNQIVIQIVLLTIAIPIFYFIDLTSLFKYSIIGILVFVNLYLLIILRVRKFYSYYIHYKQKVIFLKRFYNAVLHHHELQYLNNIDNKSYEDFYRFILEWIFSENKFHENIERPTLSSKKIKDYPSRKKLKDSPDDSTDDTGPRYF